MDAMLTSLRCMVQITVPEHRKQRQRGEGQTEQRQQPAEKIIRCVHSKHLLARAGLVLRPPSASSPGPSQAAPNGVLPSGAGDILVPLLPRAGSKTSRTPSTTPSTKTIGMGVSQEEADAMYALSADTGVIERFISHSWSAPRLSKWLALCDVYYRNFALGCALAWWVAASSIGIGLRLRTADAQPWAAALAVYVLAPAWIFGYAFLQGPDALGSTCFLDKLCVHQADPKLKLAGIRSLGDCLRASRNLTILWSDDYFERLWCILEIAVFVSSAPDIDAAMTQITLAPLWLPHFLLGLLACNLLAIIVDSGLQGTAIYMDLLTALGFEAAFGVYCVIIYMLPALLMCWVLRRKSERVAAVLLKLASFALDEVKVTVESDRQVVYRQLKALFGTTERFEEYMRTKFCCAVVRRVGEPYQVRYIWAAIVFQPCLWLSTTTICQSDQQRTAELGDISMGGWMVINYLYAAVSALAVYPLVLQMVSVGQRLSRALPAGPALLLDVFVFQGFNFLLNAGLAWLIEALTEVLEGQAS